MRFSYQDIVAIIKIMFKRDITILNHPDESGRKVVVARALWQKIFRPTYFATEKEVLFFEKFLDEAKRALEKNEERYN